MRVHFSIINKSLCVFICSVIYAMSLNHAYGIYLNKAWEYYGFIFFDNGVAGYLFQLSLIGFVSLVMPAKYDTPTELIVLILFSVVFIPAVVITTNISQIENGKYTLLLVALALVFFILGLIGRTKFNSLGNYLPGKFLDIVLVGIWFLLFIYLIVKYASVMRFVGLDEVYDQRLVGASDSLFDGYAQTYYSMVISPALLALGMIRRNYLLVFLGVVGCLVMYSINAQRTVFMIPVVLMLIYFTIKNLPKFFLSSMFLLLFFSCLVFLSASFYEQSKVAAFFATFFLFRTIALPGLSFSQYYDVFSQEGFTYWSHVKGINLLIDAPPAFVADTHWPNLGYIIGDRVYNSADNNANANLFSGDGAAAAGAFGVLLIGFIFAMWLIVLKKISLVWRQDFLVLVIAPVGIALTNGHFFTVMLSFGGLFWLLLIYFLPKLEIKSAEKR